MWFYNLYEVPILYSEMLYFVINLFSYINISTVVSFFQDVNIRKKISKDRSSKLSSF